MPKLFPTSLVGSYPQPDWLIDRKKLAGRFPPRVRAKELWRVAPEWLDQAQDDATILAIRDQERAGLDIITDGEMRRESYSNRFATALEGVDIDNPGTALDRSGHPNPVPRVTGKIRRKHAVEVRDLEFLKANTDRMVKMTVPGPFTMSQQAQNDFYESEEELALDYAAAVNEEIKDLFAAGADIVQIDEPYMQARPEKARQYGLTAVKRALDGVTGTTALHICFGYAAIIHVRPSGYSFLPELADTPLKQISIETAQSKLDTSVLAKLPGKTIILGVIDLTDMNVETPETVAERIRRALPHVPAEKIIVAPDCGMKYLPRDVAFGKMKAMVDGAAIVRRELQVAALARAERAGPRSPARRRTRRRAAAARDRHRRGRPAAGAASSSATRAAIAVATLPRSSPAAAPRRASSPPISAQRIERHHRADQRAPCRRARSRRSRWSGRREQRRGAAEDVVQLLLDEIGELPLAGAGEVDAVAGPELHRLAATSGPVATYFPSSSAKPFQMSTKSQTLRLPLLAHDAVEGAVVARHGARSDRREPAPENRLAVAFSASASAAMRAA